jgi:hypothetical protein
MHEEGELIHLFNHSSRAALMHKEELFPRALSILFSFFLSLLCVLEMLMD